MRHAFLKIAGHYVDPSYHFIQDKIKDMHACYQTPIADTPYIADISLDWNQGFAPAGFVEDSI